MSEPIRRQLRFALVVAAVLAGNRIFVDFLVPPHIRWWFTGVVVFINSLVTSAYWITRRVYRPAAQHLTKEES